MCMHSMYAWDTTYLQFSLELTRFAVWVKGNIDKMVPQQFTQQQIHGCCFRFSTGRAWHGKLWTTRQVARLNKKNIGRQHGESLRVNWTLQADLSHRSAWNMEWLTQVRMKTLAQGLGEQRVEQHPSQHKTWIDLMQLLIHWQFTWLVTPEDFEVVSQIPYRETSKNTAATSTSKNSSTMDKGWSWMFVFEAVHSIDFQPNSSTSILCALWIFADTWCHLVFFFFGFPGHFREFRDLWAEQRQRSFFQCLPWAPLKAWGLSILRPQWTFETLGLKFEWHC